MIVECRLDDLIRIIGKDLTLSDLEDTLFLMKAEVESVEGNIIEIEINPDRPDMLSTEGIARAIKAFRGVTSGLNSYPVKKSGKKIIVRKGLKKIRQYIACGIVRGVESSDELIKEYMHLQESLTATHGRNRKKASIGLYVYDEIHFPISYCLKKPEMIRFVPLGYEKEMDGLTIITEHEKGIIYGSIISSHKKWPLLIDAENNVLSLPPVINSNELGRVDATTRNIFVEVTGTHLLTVNQALSIMITSLAERGGKIESITVEYPDGTEVETPNLKPMKMTISVDKAKALLGLNLKDSEIIKCLKKMSYGTKISKKGYVDVKIPAFRTDILHPVDIMEDIAIGYGFDKIIPSMPQTMTSGKLLPSSRFINHIRNLMIGVGYQEVKSFIMSSPEIISTKMNRNQPYVTTGNPKSHDYSILRNSILPVLIDFIAQNQHADYPQMVFEVGDIVIPAEKEQTRTMQIPALCGIITDIRVNITNLMNDIAFVLRGLGLDGEFKFVEQQNPSYIKGRSAKILIRNTVVGTFGEMSPEILNQFEITKPVVAFEMQFTRDGLC